jgi:hypothetical protein
MDLDEVAPVVDPDHAAVAADVHALADVPSGDRVERVVELDVVIGMDRRRRPGRAVEGLRAQRQEGRLLDGVEDHARDLAGGAVQSARS